jgi:hypothetical protein
MNNYFDITITKVNLIFDDEPFTKREAWQWLIDNSIKGQLPCSIRCLASKWRWHRSKVERFLVLIKSESLIETEIKSGKLLLIIRNSKHLINSIQKLESVAEIISRQNQDSDPNIKQLQDNNEDIVTQVNTTLEENEVTNQRQERDINQSKEEKKKRTKKRKEERALKEKNIPFGNKQKEKSSQSVIPFELVETSDVAQWVEEVLQVSINLPWEIGKFKDYWLSTRKKPPKDGVAAFRNWLRTAIEINNKQGNKNVKFSRTNSEKRTGFEKFLAGGVRAIARVSEHRLDRNNAR